MQMLAPSSDVSKTDVCLLTSTSLNLQLKQLNVALDLHSRVHIGKYNIWYLQGFLFKPHVYCYNCVLVQLGHDWISYQKVLIKIHNIKQHYQHRRGLTILQIVGALGRKITELSGFFFTAQVTLKSLDSNYQTLKQCNKNQTDFQPK